MGAEQAGPRAPSRPRAAAGRPGPCPAAARARRPAAKRQNRPGPGGARGAVSVSPHPRARHPAPPPPDSRPGPAPAGPPPTPAPPPPLESAAPPAQVAARVRGRAASAPCACGRREPRGSLDASSPVSQRLRRKYSPMCYEKAARIEGPPATWIRSGRCRGFRPGCRRACCDGVLCCGQGESWRAVPVDWRLRPG
nr:protein transport protein SEC31-like [Equus asinus]